MHRMKITKLTKAIFRSNRGFTAAFAFFYILQAALTMWMLVLPSSIRGTIEKFAEEYNMAQAYIISDITSDTFGERMEEISGIASADARFVLDRPMTMPDGRVITPRFIRVCKDSFQDMYVYEKLDEEASERCRNMPEIRTTSSFASRSGLSVGSILDIGGREVVLSEIVTCPEGMFFFRDETSWYDNTDFALIFVDEEDFDELFGTSGYANEFLLLFKDGADEQKALDEAAELLGDGVISSYLYEGSDAQKTLYENLDTVTLIAYTLPVLILVVSVLFSCLFIYQVISKMSRMIGLMRAAGCRYGEVLAVFLSYIGIIAIPSSLVGMGAGMGLVVYTAGIYKYIYSLPYIAYSGNILLMILIPFIIVFSGMVSCLMCSGSIARIRPAEAYTENSTVSKQKSPKLLERTDLGVYTKIALGTVLRSPKRFIMSVACITACFCIILTAVCFWFSKNLAGKLTFDIRYRYDCLVYLNDPELSVDEMRKTFTDTEYVSEAEPVYVFFEDIEYGGKKSHVQINGISESSAMIFPPDVNGEALSVSNEGIILEENTAKELDVKVGDTVNISGQSVRVTAISRQQVNLIQYCSYQQAQSLNGGFPNAAALTVADGTDRAEFSREISGIKGYSHCVYLSNQETDMMNDMRSFDIPALVIMGFAIAAGTVITYNMFTISINEKRREYALMIIQGVSRSKLYLITLAESAAQYAVSCVLGMAAGPLVAGKMLEIISMGGQKFPMTDLGLSLLISAAATLAYITIGSLLTQKMIREIDLPSVINGSGK